MIQIDGSEGEGGGQVLRTSVALSALTNKPLRVFNIRAKRPYPGLMPQHLNAVAAVADLCDAQVKGLSIGAKEIEFIPSDIRSGKISVDVGTAGSATLVLQALMVPAMNAPGDVRIRVRGGTDVRWSPSADYMRYVTIPVLKKMGYLTEVELLERGYYPSGGGRIDIVTHPVKKLESLHLTEPGRLVTVKGVSHAHSDLGKALVAERCAKTARSILYNKLANTGFTRDIVIKNEYVKTLSYGSGITLYAETENTILGADALGEKGKRAEDVGKEAAEKLVEEITSKAAVDRYMADQLIPYLAVAGGSVMTGRQPSIHALTNAAIVNRFGYKVDVSGSMINAEKQLLEKR